MRRFIKIILFLLLVLWAGLPVIYGAVQANRADAKNVINRTAAVIAAARQIAAQGQKFGGLGLAVAHQHYAQDLFKHTLYSDAIFHSLRARVLAARIITLNKSDMLNEALYDRFEEQYVRESPPEQELYQKLKEAKIEIPGDQAAASSMIDMGVD